MRARGLVVPIGRDVLAALMVAMGVAAVRVGWQAHPLVEALGSHAPVIWMRGSYLLQAAAWLLAAALFIWPRSWRTRPGCIALFVLMLMNLSQSLLLSVAVRAHGPLTPALSATEVEPICRAMLRYSVAAGLLAVGSVGFMVLCPWAWRIAESPGPPDPS